MLRKVAGVMCALALSLGMGLSQSGPSTADAGVCPADSDRLYVHVGYWNAIQYFKTAPGCENEPPVTMLDFTTDTQAKVDRLPEPPLDPLTEYGGGLAVDTARNSIYINDLNGGERAYPSCVYKDTDGTLQPCPEGVNPQSLNEVNFFYGTGGGIARLRLDPTLGTQLAQSAFTFADFILAETGATVSEITVTLATPHLLHVDDYVSVNSQTICPNSCSSKKYLGIFRVNRIVNATTFTYLTNGKVTMMTSANDYTVNALGQQLCGLASASSPQCDSFNSPWGMAFDSKSQTLYMVDYASLIDSKDPALFDPQFKQINGQLYRLVPNAGATCLYCRSLVYTKAAAPKKALPKTYGGATVNAAGGPGQGPNTVTFDSSTSTFYISDDRYGNGFIEWYKNGASAAKSSSGFLNLGVAHTASPNFLVVDKLGSPSRLYYTNYDNSGGAAGTQAISYANLTGTPGGDDLNLTTKTFSHDVPWGSSPEGLSLDEYSSALFWTDGRAIYKTTLATLGQTLNTDQLFGGYNSQQESGSGEIVKGVFSDVALVSKPHTALRTINTSTHAVTEIRPQIKGFAMKPLIKGGAKVATTAKKKKLTCVTPVWETDRNWAKYYDAPGTVAYQWFKDGVPLSGATATTYVIPKAPVVTLGAHYKCSVTATNVIGSTKVESLDVISLS